MEWLPEPGPGRIIGGAIAGLAGLLAIALFFLFATADGALRALWLIGGLLALGAFSAIILGIRRLDAVRYHLGPDSLDVAGPREPLRIPYGAIREIAYEPGDQIRAPGYERYWPGFYLSRMAVHGESWRSVATVPPARRVRLRLGDGSTLAISPQRPILFAHALEQRIVEAAPVRVAEPARQSTESLVELPAAPGPREQVAADVRRGRPNAVTLFRDLILRGDRVTSDALAAALIGLVIMCTITVWRSDTISTSIAVHWNARGEPARFVEPQGIWIIEGVWIYFLSAVVVLVVNTALATFAAWRGDRMLARLLVGAVPAIELILLIALWQAPSA